MRTWVFIANRKLTGSETTKVEEEIKNFLAQWKSHGKPIKANGFCFENAAIVLVADETDVQASGCSIDKINQWLEKGVKPTNTVKNLLLKANIIKN